MLNSIVGWLSRSFLAGLLQYLAKYMALLSNNFGGNFLLSKSVFGYLKKNPMVTKLEGEGVKDYLSISDYLSIYR